MGWWPTCCCRQTTSSTGSSSDDSSTDGSGNDYSSVSVEGCADCCIDSLAKTEYEVVVPDIFSLSNPICNDFSGTKILDYQGEVINTVGSNTNYSCTWRYESKGNYDVFPDRLCWRNLYILTMTSEYDNGVKTVCFRQLSLLSGYNRITNGIASNYDCNLNTSYPTAYIQATYGGGGAVDPEDCINGFSLSKNVISLTTCGAASGDWPATLSLT